MKTFGIGLCAAAISGLATAEVPQVSDVTMSQDASTRLVTVSYKVDMPAIVTFSVETNTQAGGTGEWVSIGDRNVREVSGEGNVLVRDSSVTHTLYWQPMHSWPGQKVASGSCRAVVTAWATNTPPDYVAVDLVKEDHVFFYASADAVPGGVTNNAYKTDMLLLRKIPASSVRWRMGSPSKELGSENYRDREVLHYVTLTEDYFMGVYPLTQRQYYHIKGSNPSAFQSGDEAPMRPVSRMSYDLLRGTGYVWPGDKHKVSDNSFLDLLREHAGVDTFDLPTDAQWEFACRAGVGAALYTGKELVTGSGVDANVDEIAWYKRNSGEMTHAVGQKKPNDWGLYDMIGNVAEWCLDWYWTGNDYSDGSDVTDPTGGSSAPSGSKRVLRGSAYSTEVNAGCRSASRTNSGSSDNWDHLGCRISCGVVFK